MKKVALLLVVIFSFGVVDAQTTLSKDEMSRWSLGAKFGIDYYRLYSPSQPGSTLFQDYMTRASWAPALVIERTLNPYFGLGAELGYYSYNRYHLTGGTLDLSLVGSVNLSNLLSPNRTRTFWKKTNFYFNTGIGIGYFNSKRSDLKEEHSSMSGLFTTALNAEHNLSKAFALSLELQHRSYNRTDMAIATIPGKDNTSAFVASIGVRYKFNANKKTHTRNMSVEEYYPAPTALMDVELVQVMIDESIRTLPAINPEPQQSQTGDLEDKIKELEKENAALVNKLKQLEEDLKNLQKEENTKVNASFENIEFNFNSDKLTEDSKKLLDKIITILKENKTWSKIEIAGYADNVGDAEYNKTLSQQRANSVKAYLVAHGFSASEITAVGYGSEKPIASNSTPEGRQKNRRVEFEMTK